ncbi:RagB/SusD family nutrient uptake outer membrane protein [Chitinophaga sp. HK235]|uniref:RagB/SusD family nutrient uptake outer membrane protein n=1 Tax=Chitinophaga sp. HK235 TaxID=2952571 RepID=UPI001BA528A4|nr:RagB/SusD family nutrient uptake outer membrane protein [Chitinophaga sp. HK235]
MQYQKIITNTCRCLLLAVVFSSCKKLVSVPDPINTISTGQVFSSEKQANGAMAGIYTRMINADDNSQAATIGHTSFAAGMSTLLAGVSSDEMYNYQGAGDQQFYLPNTNKLTAYNAGFVFNIWSSAYTAIYGANAVIEGIAASTSSNLKDSVRRALTGEAKFVRAFSYFYLTNFYGDVPLALTTDFNKTCIMSRTPQQQIYQQLVADLKDAVATMPEAYPTSSNERVRPNRYAALALLARVYLYQKDYANAADAASGVINHTDLYQLEASLDNVFSPASREALWQLKPAGGFILNNALPEAYLSLPNPLHTGSPGFCLTDIQLKAFETGDKRFVSWVDSSQPIGAPNTPPPPLGYYSNKYKIGTANSSFGAPFNEYQTPLRLAEMYLIRAEAAANGGPGGMTSAISDLNIIRNRAGLPALPASLNQDQLLAAIAKERQTEFFAEWGHRWFDLKRTAKAHNVLSAIPLKQPWAGDFQLLYPIPPAEINVNHFLTQNPGY